MKIHNNLSLGKKKYYLSLLFSQYAFEIRPYQSDRKRGGRDTAAILSGMHRSFSLAGRILRESIPAGITQIELLGGGRGKKNMEFFLSRGKNFFQTHERRADANRKYIGGSP